MLQFGTSKVEHEKISKKSGTGKKDRRGTDNEGGLSFVPKKLKNQEWE